MMAARFAQANSTACQRCGESIPPRPQRGPGGRAPLYCSRCRQIRDARANVKAAVTVLDRLDPPPRDRLLAIHRALREIVGELDR